MICVRGEGLEGPGNNGHPLGSNLEGAGAILDPGSREKMQRDQSHIFCVAPMMDRTDRHCRYFHRLLSKHALLFSEMVTADAVLHGDRDQLLAFNPEEHPVVLQLAGSDPRKLAAAAAIGEGYGYDAINLNVGCPSDRVQEGRFGACLMAEPSLVGACVAAMLARVEVPVSVKCRLGIDDQDQEGDLERFIGAVAAAGCRTFLVHARKAWLKGLSPKQNRDVPPLDPARVYRLKAEHPQLTIVLNGGIASIEEAQAHLQKVDGVALGRAAYQNPGLLADVDRLIFGEHSGRPSRREVLEQLVAYAHPHVRRGGRLNNVTRHILGLYHGLPHGRAFRRHLSEHAPRADAGVEVLIGALSIVEGDGSATASHAAVASASC
jgi:tRNA-dihydrouridine synthase A